MDQSITIRSGDLSCGETTRLFASRLLYGPVCIPLQLGMLFMCVVMLVWDVIRQHFWRDATLDDIYVDLDYLMCALLALEVTVRAIATQAHFWTDCFNYIDLFVLVLIIATNVIMHTRLDRYLGDHRSKRDAWVLIVYALRYAAQVLRFVMILLETNRSTEMIEACEELTIKMDGDVTAYKPSINSCEGPDDGLQMESYQGGGGYQAEDYYTTPTSIISAPLQQTRRYGKAASSYERRKSAEDVLRSAFDVTPLDSPSESHSWADAVSPRRADEPD
mmetsp:Transcript_7751/g.14915  ORF Transcript_7751/g.14915 Transcript_7751/m.14915 type:complete len:276 (-) Transcript_7751:238-1065(-)